MLAFEFPICVYNYAVLFNYSDVRKGASWKMGGKFKKKTSEKCLMKNYSQLVVDRPAIVFIIGNGAINTILIHYI